MQLEPGDDKQGNWQDWFWMVLCCVPMVAIVVLIALGFF